MIDFRTPVSSAETAQIARCDDPYLAMLLRSLSEPRGPARTDLANPVRRDLCGAQQEPHIGPTSDSFVIFFRSESARS